MASPSPKRRRTSPHASIPVNAVNTDLSAILNDESPQAFSQPSYMTPTKASLARFHPHLIAQPSRPTTPRSKGRLLLDQRSSTLKGSLISPTKVSQSPRPDSVASAAFLNSVAHASTDLQDADSSQARELVSTATHVPHSNRSNGSATGPTQDIGDHEPRASPPAEAAGEGGSAPATVQDLDEDVAEISRESSQSRDPDLEAAVLAQSPRLNNRGTEPKLKTSTSTDHDDKLDDGLVTISTPLKHKAAEDDEPKLPSTPRQLGIEPPGSKPTGVFSISPSRNSRRRRASNTKSSPLKPRNVAPVQHVFETELETTLGPRPHIAVASGEAAPALGPLGHRLERDSCLSVMPNYSISQLPETDPLHDIQDNVSLDITVSDVVSSKGGLGTTFRDVVIRSRSGILGAEIRMFLKDSGKVASITAIALTSWASELGKWLNAPIADRTQDSVIWAICRFWDMAEIRACCWYNCKAEFKHLCDNTGHASTEIVSDTAETPSDGKSQENGELGIGSRIEQPESSSFSNVLPAETLYHCMGLNSIRFSDSAVKLEVSWAINFTPSGKVTSRVSSHASFPTSWAEEDRDDLTRTDEAFKRLVESGKPVYEAVRCIVEVMFPDSRA